MDGWITIGTELSTDKFDKQVYALEKRIEKEEEKKIEIEADIDIKESGIKKVQEAMDKAPAKLDRLIAQINEAEAAMESISPDSVEYDIANQKLLELKIQAEACLEIMRQGPKVIDKQTEEIEKLKAKQTQVNEKVDEYKQKIENINIQRQQVEIEKMKNSFNGVGSAIQSGVKKLGAMAISIIGIRAGINLLKSASSELATYDEQYAANLEYIRFVLTQAIAPVLRGIVQLAMTLLSYINAIVQAWFGINLFSSGSAENFKKMKKQAGGVSKAVKEIKKQLAGFDEVNILTDQSDSGTSAGAGGVGMPTMDLSTMQAEPPAWLQWIIDHKDVILAVLGGIAAALIAIKLGAGGIKALGIGIMVTGIIMAVQGLIGYLNDPSWENFGKVIQGIGLIIVGFGVLIGGIPAIVIGAVVLIVGTIIRYWEQIKGFLQRGIEWLKGKSDFVGQKFGGWVKGLYDTFVGFLELVLRYFDGTFNAIKRIFNGVIQFFQGVFTGDWNKAWEGIKNIVGGVIEWCTTRFKVFFDWVDRVILTPLKSLIDTVVNGIKNALNLGGNLKVNFGGGVSKAINIPGFKVGGIVTIPKLAGGGLVNMPNRGTLLGSAIVGEGGPEGVIPLTDAQAMAELGEAIGKHVTINATMINKMNTRTISREILRAQNEQNFAYNG